MHHLDVCLDAEFLQVRAQDLVGGLKVHQIIRNRKDSELGVRPHPVATQEVGQEHEQIAVVDEPPDIDRAPHLVDRQRGGGLDDDERLLAADDILEELNVRVHVTHRVGWREHASGVLGCHLDRVSAVGAPQVRPRQHDGVGRKHAQALGLQQHSKWLGQVWARSQHNICKAADVKRVKLVGQATACARAADLAVRVEHVAVQDRVDDSKAVAFL
mmetsp:Transcript_6151/g.19948  ORF Transcript_6151/g.19948 Transcript_6151/m.19948 type:complete len:215 (+) Transcript_6151:1274-1918(+)